MKKYIIRDSKGQKTITYAKNIVDAVSYIKDREPVQSTVSRNERVDMNWVEKHMRYALDATWFRIDKLKVSLKLKTKKELYLYITVHNKSDYQYVDYIPFILYLKDHKSEDDLMEHAKELEKDLSSLVGKLYEKKPVKKPENKNKIVSVFKEEVFVFPGQKFSMRDISQIMWRKFRKDEYSSKKSKVEVFNKDKITVSLNFVKNTCSYILLFTLLSKACKTEEEFKKYAEDLKKEIQRFSSIPERSWYMFG